MPRIAFDQKFSGETEKFPQLKLERGERIRLVCLETPWLDFRHELRAPVLENGAPKMVTKKTKKGVEYSTFDTDFKGNHICLGKADALDDPLFVKGIDPERCPECAASLRCGDIKPPVRRYAMNVVVYTIRQDQAFTVKDPFTVTVACWPFTSNRYDRLLALQARWGNLRNHDLLLGPCEDADFQKYEIDIAETAAWQATEETRAAIVKLWRGEGSRATDAQLRAACGHTATLQQMKDDAAEVERLWSMARGAGPAPSGAPAARAAAAELDQGLSALLDETPAVHPLEAKAAAEAKADDIFGAAGDPFAAPAQSQAPADPFGPGAPGAPGSAASPASAPASPAPASAPTAAASAVPSDGLDEFAAPTTSNPAKAAPAPAAPAPAAEAAAPGSGPVSLDDLFSLS